MLRDIKKDFIIVFFVKKVVFWKVMDLIVKNIYTFNTDISQDNIEIGKIESAGSVLNFLIEFNFS